MGKKSLLLVGPLSHKGGIGSFIYSQLDLIENCDDIKTDIFNISSLRDSLGNLKNLARKIQKCDIVHIHCAFRRFESSLQLLIPISISSLMRRKVIVTVHTGELEPYLKNNQTYLQLLISFADVLTVPSNFQKNLFLKYDITAERKIPPLHNFIDEFYIKKSASIQERKQDWVVTATEINEYKIKRKGLYDFLKIAESMPELQFILVGKITDEYGRQLKEKSPDNLIMPGFVSKERLAEFYARSKIYLQLSRSESFGLAVGEAMLFDCIPIVYNQGSLPEVVDKEGFVVDYKDIEGVKQKIRYILENDVEKKPRERVLDNYTPTHYLEEYKKIIRKL